MLVKDIPFEKLNLKDKVYDDIYGSGKIIGLTKKISTEDEIENVIDVYFGTSRDVSCGFWHRGCELTYDEKYEPEPPRMKFAFGVKETILLWTICYTKITGETTGLRSLFNKESREDVKYKTSISEECEKFLAEHYGVNQNTLWKALDVISADLFERSMLAADYPPGFLQKFESLLGK